MKTALTLTALTALATFSLTGCIPFCSGMPLSTPPTPYPYGGSYEYAKKPTKAPTPDPDEEATPGTMTVTGSGDVRSMTVSLDRLTLGEGRSQRLGVTVEYRDGTQDADVTMTSSDPAIATVNPETGVVTAVRAGIARVRVRAVADPTVAVTVSVTVREGDVEDLIARVAPASAALTPGDTLQLKSEIVTSSASAHVNGTWTSSNPQVAFVNATGLVTARKPGHATISFSSNQDVTVSATAGITVEAPTSMQPVEEPSATPTPAPVEEQESPETEEVAAE